MIIFVLLISLAARIWYLLQPTVIFWDSAMYIGIGKFLFSQGTIGTWELFRPPLLPIILGFVWKIGLPPFVIGEILSLIASIALIYTTYVLGEKSKKYAGLFAAILLSFNPIFIAFSSTPLTDVISTLFTSLVVLTVFTEKYWLTGFIIAIAFYFRFPQGLILVPIILYIFLKSYFDQEDTYSNIKNSLKVIFGFIISLLPYLILNYIAYKNPLWPVIKANTVASDTISSHGKQLLFYPRNLLIEDPFFFFAIFIFFSLWNFPKKYFFESVRTKKINLLIILCLIVIGGYFEFSTHLELRYTIAFLPFIALCAGYGLSWLFEKISLRYSWHTSRLIYYFLGMVTVILVFIGWMAFRNTWQMYKATPELQAYYAFFADKPRATVITSNPESIALSDVQIIQATDTWESGMSAYDLSGKYADYIAIDTCSMVCEKNDTCQKTAETYLTQLQSERKKVFDKTTLGCELLIYAR